MQQSPARALLLPIFLTATLATGARAARLDLPVWTPGSPVAAPYYRGDVLEIRLSPAAARAVLPRGAGPTRARPSGRLGVPAIDALLPAIGGLAFEPEFRGELPPTPGEEPDFTAFQLLRLAPGADLGAALDRLRALPEVASADPIGVLPVSSLPNDSLAFATIWLFKDQPSRTDIRAPEAWQVTTGDTSIVVAIIDTGVIPYHPDLGGRGGERGQMWVNWAERNGLPGVDDDGNGYVDDDGGWDFVAGPLGGAADPGEDGQDEDNDPNDWGGHGTAVAGIVGAIAGNGIGLAGVAPRVRLMPLRIGYLQAGGTPPSGVVDMSYAAAAIRYATRMGAAVLNCSWESLNQGGLAAAVTAATRAGVVVVNASGNGGTPNTYLGTRDDVIAVAATDSTDAVWLSAVRGPWVDLSADGVNMASTMLDRLSADSLGGRTPSYRYPLSGTSFAAPQIAGAVALLQAQRRERGELPLTPAGALLRVRETADDIGAQNPGLTGYGTGRLDLFRALTDPPRSLAVRGRARSVGPPVVIRYNTGRSLVVYAMSDRSLVAYDGASGDTVWVHALPGAPAGNIAAADFRPPYGPLIAVATTAGGVALFSDDGRVVPGWPVVAQSGVSLQAGVAIADLDQDGQPEIVAGGTSIPQGSHLWAWHADGTLVSGFPFDTGTLGISAPALGDLDGVPGAEIAFTDGNGALHVVRGDGTELDGFPVAAGASGIAPVIARLGRPGTAPRVVVASPGLLKAYASDGSQRMLAGFSGAPLQDPVLADLDGDGVDEIVLATSSPATIDVHDTLGAEFTGRPGWPASVAGGAQGPLLVGPLAPLHGPCVAFFGTGGFQALDDSAHALGQFPKPGGAGLYGAIGELDGDGATEIAAGSALADSNIYTYDAGAGTWSPTLAQWPAVRGDQARTASHGAGTPGPLLIDRIRPARVTDLEAHATSTTSVLVRYTVTGDDSLTGRASSSVLRRASYPLDDQNFGTGILVPRPPPGPSGSTDTVTVAPLPEGSTWWFAVRMEDAALNASAVSNADSAALPGLPPAVIADLRVLSVRETTAVLAWTATGDDGVVGRPLGYRISASPSPLDASNLDAAPIQILKPALHDPGEGETLAVVRLTPGRRWRFAVRGVDQAQTTGAISNVAEAVTPVGGALAGRPGMALAPRPMPATGNVTIDWQGDASGTVPQWLVVYDLSGRERRRVALGSEPGGSYKWDGRDGESRLLPAGLYFLRLISGARHADSRVVFVR